MKRIIGMVALDTFTAVGVLFHCAFVDQIRISADLLYAAAETTVGQEAPRAASKLPQGQKAQRQSQYLVQKLEWRADSHL